ncbi:MAG TPA: DUF4389 domain-containing protein [Thermoleophilaceae bacterium]|nr:DUF4389 domain-containing protein [Thermoleophilaceae bacterium]
MTDLDGRIRVTHSDDGDRSRPAVFFRFIIMVPHFLWLALWSIGAVLVLPVHWVIALVRGGPADWAHAFYSAYVRYALHVYAYFYLAAGRYPGFLGEPGYVIEADFPPAGRQRRWTIALRLFLALPALVLATILSNGAGGSYNSGSGGTDTTTAAFSYSGLGFTLAVLAWFASLALARTPGGLRDAQVYCQGYAAQAFAYLFLLNDRYPTSDPQAVPLDPMPAHPVRLRAGDDRDRNRLTVFFRILLAIPHFVWLFIWSLAALLVAIAGWFAALATGRLPDPLHRFLGAYLRYGTHVNSYVVLLGGPFPGFTGRAGSYPVELEIDEPDSQHRAKTAFRVILAIPAWLAAGGFGAVSCVAAVGAWFSALATGRVPEGLHGLLGWAVRYQAQFYAYLLLLTDRYPYTGPDGRGRAVAEPIVAPEQPAAWGAAPERP